MYRSILVYCTFCGPEFSSYSPPSPFPQHLTQCSAQTSRSKIVLIPFPFLSPAPTCPRGGLYLHIVMWALKVGAESLKIRASEHKRCGHWDSCTAAAEREFVEWGREADRWSPGSQLQTDTCSSLPEGLATCTAAPGRGGQRRWALGCLGSPSASSSPPVTEKGFD